MRFSPAIAACLLAGCGFGLTAIDPGTVDPSDDSGDTDGGTDDNGVDGGTTDSGAGGDTAETDSGTDSGGSDDTDSGTAIERFPMRGDLVITEIMATPEAVTEDKGEWFELYNPTSSILVLDSLEIRDEGSDAITIPAADNVRLGPGEYGTICRYDDYTENGGAVCLWGWQDLGSYELQIAGSGDELIVAAGDIELDAVKWDGSWGMTSGRAMGLDSAQLDPIANDSASAWCNQTSIMDKGDQGTPGEENDGC